jgi:colicin import membrane protein
MANMIGAALALLTAALLGLLSVAHASGGSGDTGSLDYRPPGLVGPATTNVCASRIALAIRRHVPRQPPPAHSLRASVEILTDAGGNITSFRLIKSSESPQWDRAALEAVEKAGRLPKDDTCAVPDRFVLVLDSGPP